MPVLLNFLLYSDFISNSHFVSRSLLKIWAKIDLRLHLINCFSLFSGESIVSLLVLFSVWYCIRYFLNSKLHQQQFFIYCFYILQMSCSRESLLCRAAVPEPASPWCLWEPSWSSSSCWVPKQREYGLCTTQWQYTSLKYSGSSMAASSQQ